MHPHSRALTAFVKYLLFQQLHNRSGCSGIQPSGGLIKEQDLRLNDQLHSNIGTFPLSTRDTSDEFIPNLKIVSTIAMCEYLQMPTLPLPQGLCMWRMHKANYAKVSILHKFPSLASKPSPLCL